MIMDASAAGVIDGKILMQFGSRYPAPVSSEKFGSLPASRAGIKAREGQPSITQKEYFLQGKVLKRIFMNQSQNSAIPKSLTEKPQS